MAQKNDGHLGYTDTLTVLSFFSVQILENQNITLPANMEECCGTASAFDLHVDELSDEEVHILTGPVPVLRYM